MKGNTGWRSRRTLDKTEQMKNPLLIVLKSPIEDYHAIFDEVEEDSTCI